MKCLARRYMLIQELRGHDPAILTELLDELLMRKIFAFVENGCVDKPG